MTVVKKEVKMREVVNVGGLEVDLSKAPVGVKEKIVKKKQMIEVYNTKLTRWDDIKEAVTKLRKQIEAEVPELLGLDWRRP